MDRRADLALSILVALYGAGLIIVTVQFDSGVLLDPVGSKGVPYAVGGLLLVLGLLLVGRRVALWNSSNVPSEGTEDEPGVPASAMRAFGLMGLTFAYAAAFSTAGYVISTLSYTVLALILLGRRSLPVLLFVPALYTATTFLLFAVVMKVRLPLGLIDSLLSPGP